MAAEHGPPAQPGTMDDGLNAVKEGWFTELSTMWPGQGLSLEVKEVLFRQRSKFQVTLGGHLSLHFRSACLVERLVSEGCIAKDGGRVRWPDCVLQSTARLPQSSQDYSYQPPEAASFPCMLKVPPAVC